jgi:hypothetical protein
MIQAVSSYIYDGGERDADGAVGWGDAGDAIDVLANCEGMEKEGMGMKRERRTNSQSITLSCVKQNINSSITRSTPTVLLTSSSCVSSGLFRIK